MGIPGAGGPPSLLRGGERCSLVGGEWGRVEAERMSTLFLAAGHTDPGAAGPCGAPKGPHTPVFSPPSHAPVTPNCLSFFTGGRRFLISVTLSLCPLCQDGTRSLRPG